METFHVHGLDGSILLRRQFFSNWSVISMPALPNPSRPFLFLKESEREDRMGAGGGQGERNLSRLHA